MPTSQARIDANRRNARLSTGPKSPEGKERSRANALKHGLSGAGVVSAGLDAAEVERRHDELMLELAPRSALGKLLVRDLAALSVRMERSARAEVAAVAAHVRHAGDDFDEARHDEADRLMDELAESPRAALRKLRRSPEGVERLLEAWADLRDDLARAPRPAWTARHRERLLNLAGRKVGDLGNAPLDALSSAIGGDFAGLTPDEGAHLDGDHRALWARDRLLERIDAEVAGLEAHFETLDFETIELDRLDAPARALFDPSQGATLARRYEADARRGFFRALKEFRQAEAEAEAEAARTPGPAATSKPDAGPSPLASSRDRPMAALRQPIPTPGTTRVVAEGADFGPKDPAASRIGASLELAGV